MPAPFYNAIKGTTAGTPGTGAFTPNAASSTLRAWSWVPSGTICLVRYEDGSAWELCYSYWNGTTLSRASTQIPHNSDGTLQTSSGSQLSLTSAATAAMVVDGADIMSHLGETSWRAFVANIAGTFTAIGLSQINTGNTTSAGTVATTNYLTEQVRTAYTSLTTANAQGGLSASLGGMVVSTSAGHGGFEMTASWGASQIPTGPRIFVGATSTTYVGSTAEPSAFQSASYAAFAKDSADANIQLLTNDGTASNGTKVDTGIAFAVNGWFRSVVWCEPGSNRAYGLLIRLDTGAIWTSSTTTDAPANGAILIPNVIGGLSSTTGTAIIMNVGTVLIRTGV